MATGTVKFFNELKGFGFITPDDGSAELFVHVSGLLENENIAEGDKVSYDVQEGRKGLTAVKVKPL